MKKRIVYVFYVFDGIKSFDEVEAYKLHFRCLEHFANVFNEAMFIITADDLNNPLIDQAKNFFYRTFSHCPVDIYVEQNDKYNREGPWYYKYIVKELNNLDGYTWFGHTKGLQNEHMENRLPSYWITSMYYFSLMFDPAEVLSNKYVAFGFPCFFGGYSKTHLSFLEDEIKDNIENLEKDLDTMDDLMKMYVKKSKFISYDHVWLISGSLYWMNCQKIYQYVQENDIPIDFDNYPPYWYNLKWVAEYFLPDLFSIYDVNYPFRDLVHKRNVFFDSHKKWFEEMYKEFTPYKNEFVLEYIKDFTPAKELIEYLEFHKSICG